FRTIKLHIQDNKSYFSYIYCCLGLLYSSKTSYKLLCESKFCNDTSNGGLIIFSAPYLRWALSVA
ncbi:unnamed protein product, partial [Acanthoscelides obtectus]